MACWRRDSLVSCMRACHQCQHINRIVLGCRAPRRCMSVEGCLGPGPGPHICVLRGSGQMQPWLQSIHHLSPAYRSSRRSTHAASPPGLREPRRLHAGLVEHAVLVGMPVSARPARWSMARRAVAGRLINGYSQHDWVLAAVYGATSGFARQASGLCPVPCVGVENVNLTALVDGHFSYIPHMAEILDILGVCS